MKSPVTIDLNRMATAAVEAALGDDQPRRRGHRGMKTVAAGAALVTAAAVGQKHMSKFKLAKAAVTKLDDLPKVRDVADSVRDRFSDLGLTGDHSDDGQEPRDVVDDYAGDEVEDDEEVDATDEDGPRDEEDSDYEEDDSDDEEDDSDDQELDPQDEADDSDDEGDDSDDEEDDSADEEEGSAGPRDEDAGDDEDQDEDQDAEQRELALGIEPGEQDNGEVPDLVSALNTPQSRPPIVQTMGRTGNPAERPPEHEDSDSAEENDSGSRSKRSGARNGKSSGSGRRKSSGSGRRKKTKSAAKRG